MRIRRGTTAMGITISLVTALLASSPMAAAADTPTPTSTTTAVTTSPSTAPSAPTPATTTAATTAATAPASPTTTTSSATTAATSPAGTDRAVAAATTPTPGPAQAQVDTHSIFPYLPIATQVQQNGTWGITVGGTFYASQATSASVQGYQVLVMDRSWNSVTGANVYNPGSSATPNPYVPLTMVTNSFFAVPNDPTAGPKALSSMEATLTTPGSYNGACTGLGCYLVISSQGGMGFTSCPGKDSTADNCGAKAQPGGLFAQLGGTPSASFAPGTAPYSLVTSVSTAASSSTPTFSPTGQGTEALGCTLVAGGTAGQTTCPANTVGGVVTGAFVNYLTASGNNVTFTTTNPVSITARAVDPSSGMNTVTVTTSTGNQQYTSLADAASPTQPGFQAVALDRGTLSMLWNGTYSSSQPQGSGYDLTAMNDDLNAVNLATENVIWVIASIGTVKNTDPGMYALSQTIASIGGSFSVFNQLGVVPPGTSGCTTYGDYALIGWRQPDQAATGSAPGAGLENSGGVLCTTTGPTSGPATSVTQQALLKPDSRSFYTPHSSSGVAGASNLQQAVLQPATTSWPPSAAAPATSTCPQAAPSVAAGTPPTAGQAAAYTYLSQVIQAASDSGFQGVTDVQPDIRGSYSDIVSSSLNGSDAQVTTWTSAVNDASYPVNSYFTCQDFNGVQSELSAELGNLDLVARYTNVMYNALGEAYSEAALGYQNMYNLVNTTIQPNGKTAVAANLLSYLGTLTGDLLPIAFPGPGDVIGPGLDAVTQTVAFGLDVTDTATGAAAGNLSTTWGELDGQLDTIVLGAQNGLQTAMQLAVTDSDRLTSVATAASAYYSIDIPAYHGPPSSSALAAQISNGLAAAALGSLLGSVYSSVTLPALWGNYPKLDVTDQAYPSVALSPGGSIHRAVCQLEGACLAESQGHGYDQAQAYPMTLWNQPQPPQGAGYFYWQTSFMYLTSTCQPPSCSLYFPNKNILAILFDQVGTPVTVTAGTSSYSVTALGLWPAYVLGVGGIIPPVPQSQYNSVVCAATADNPQEDCSPDQVGQPAPTTSAPPASATPTAPPSAPPAERPPAASGGTVPPTVAPEYVAGPAAQNTSALAGTGLGMDARWLMGLGVLLLSVGVGAITTARRREGRRRRQAVDSP